MACTREDQTVENPTLAIVIMLLSAAMYALSYVLQHKGTQAAIGHNARTRQDNRSDVMRLISNPVWLSGIVLFGLSFLLHLAALAFGSVGIVQPLIVTELIFIPPFAALITKVKIAGKDWIAILAVALGLMGFLIAAAPAEGGENPSSPLWVVAIGGFFVICFALMAVGNRFSINPKAALYGCAAGVINALLALVAKGAFNAGNLLTNPLFYVMIIVALSTVWLTALAFKQGPITTSSPAMISTNPIVATIGAIWLFGEQINHGPLQIAVIAVCLPIIAWGVVALTKSDAVHAALSEEANLAKEVA